MLGVKSKGKNSTQDLSVWEDELNSIKSTGTGTLIKDSPLEDNELIGEPIETKGKKNKKSKEETKQNSMELLSERPTVADTKSFLLKIGGQVVNHRLEALGTSVEDIKRFQLFRLVKALVMLLVPVIISLLISNYIPIFVGVLGAIAIWFFDYLKVAREYENYQFKRQLDFNKFIRMLMPYLRGTGVVLYVALQKMKDRLDEGTTRTALITLITKMNSQTNSSKPYEEFAENSSGQERSKLIMQTLFDFQRSSNDSTTINELGKLVDEELSRDIDEIITRKDDRFEIEAYFLGFTILIPAFGYFIAITFDMLMQFLPTLQQ